MLSNDDPQKNRISKQISDPAQINPIANPLPNTNSEIRLLTMKSLQKTSRQHPTKQSSVFSPKSSLQQPKGGLMNIIEKIQVNSCCANSQIDTEDNQFS